MVFFKRFFWDHQSERVCLLRESRVGGYGKRKKDKAIFFLPSMLFVPKIMNRFFCHSNVRSKIQINRSKNQILDCFYPLCYFLILREKYFDILHSLYPFLFISIGRRPPFSFCLSNLSPRYSVPSC